MLQDVVVAINGAMQMLQAAGQDFFTREKMTVTLGAGTAVYSIAKTVQAILGPIRLNDSVPMRALSSRGELDQFDRIFLGNPTYGAAAGTPIAYWVENLRSGTTGDINQINIWVVPVPNSAGTLAIEIVNDAPSYAVVDLAAGTATYFPVAQNYTESVLLPIARMLITRSSQFSRPDILAGLSSDYQLAMAKLGTVGGFPNEKQATPEREVEA